MCPARFHSRTASVSFPQECNHPRCGLAASFNPSRNACSAAKNPSRKMWMQAKQRESIEQDEAHSVTRAGSVLSQGYEQLPSMFPKGMPVLILAICLYTSRYSEGNSARLVLYYNYSHVQAYTRTRKEMHTCYKLHLVEENHPLLRSKIPGQGLVRLRICREPGIQLVREAANGRLLDSSPPPAVWATTLLSLCWGKVSGGKNTQIWGLYLHENIGGRRSHAQMYVHNEAVHTSYVTLRR